MNNHPLVEEPPACGPDSVAAVYDDHAADLFKYCWFMLRNTGAAQVALRDSLIVADAHSARLSDPAQLRPWLYAVARAECARRRPSPAEDPGTPAGALRRRPAPGCCGTPPAAPSVASICRTTFRRPRSIPCCPSLSPRGTCAG